jgi:hypothetical protein
MRKQIDMTRTQWFKNCKPAHDGVYEVKVYGSKGYYCLFKHGEWSIAAISPKETIVWGLLPSGKQNKIWRGLAVKP